MNWTISVNGENLTYEEFCEKYVKERPKKIEDRIEDIEKRLDKIEYCARNIWEL